MAVGGGVLISGKWGLAAQATQFTAAIIGATAETIALATDSTDLTQVAIGIIQTDPKQNDQCTVQVTGKSKAVYAATIARGDLLTFDANGHMVVATIENSVIGQALVAGEDNDVGEILIQPWLFATSDSGL